MSFWLREIAGWVLLALSLVMMLVVYDFLVRRMILEVWPWTILTIFVFRGAIHLLKVAVAARVCQQAQDRLYPAPDAAGLARHHWSPPPLRGYRKQVGLPRLLWSRSWLILHLPTGGTSAGSPASSANWRAGYNPDIARSRHGLLAGPCRNEGKFPAWKRSPKQSKKRKSSRKGWQHLRSKSQAQSAASKAAFREGAL